MRPSAECSKYTLSHWNDDGPLPPPPDKLSNKMKRLPVVKYLITRIANINVGRVEVWYHQKVSVRLRGRWHLSDDIGGLRKLFCVCYYTGDGEQRGSVDQTCQHSNATVNRSSFSLFTGHTVTIVPRGPAVSNCFFYFDYMMFHSHAAQRDESQVQLRCQKYNMTSAYGMIDVRHY